MASQTTFTCDKCKQVIEDPINNLVKAVLRESPQVYWGADLCGSCFREVKKFMGVPRA